MQAKTIIAVTAVTLATLLLATSLPAQGLTSLQPFTRTGDILLSDSSSDKIWRLQDLDLNGDYNGPGEIIPFYDDSIPGALALNSNSDVAVAADGTAYVCDSNTDQIILLRDLNGDGDAQDVNEASVFFDGHAAVNASQIDMAGANSLIVDPSGVIWIGAFNASVGGVPLGADMILRLQDLNLDDDANDAAEAKIYVGYPGGALGDHIITDVAIAPDGHIYYSDNGVLAGIKGVYRCNDMNSDGDAQDAGEVTLYYVPPPQGGNAFLWGMTIGPDGTLYLCDTGNEIIWRGFDTNGNLQIDVGTEDQIFYQHFGPASMWEPEIASDGSLWAVDDTTPDGIVRMQDGNADGDALDLGEYVKVYDETLGAQPSIGARGMAFLRSPALVFSTNTPSIGSPLTLQIEGSMGYWFTLWASTATVSAIPAPPFGYVGISIFPPDYFFEVFNTFVPPSGTLTVPMVVPPDPVLIGLSAHVQALAGFYRLELTNTETITFMP